MQVIDIIKDTGAALLQQIDSVFGYMQSGHELFKWLDARAEASDAHGEADQRSLKTHFKMCRTSNSQRGS